mmetsp:Transcript_19166/g.48806  ORF Transcript_19166/g.48806 Transcript_19166/m.48806 type:complete len:219 (-) Transcript_19166:976-1632(-)
MPIPSLPELSERSLSNLFRDCFTSLNLLAGTEGELDFLTTFGCWYRSKTFGSLGSSPLPVSLTAMETASAFPCDTRSVTEPLKVAWAEFVSKWRSTRRSTSASVWTEPEPSSNSSETITPSRANDDIESTASFVSASRSVLAKRTGISTPCSMRTESAKSLAIVMILEISLDDESRISASDARNESAGGTGEFWATIEAWDKSFPDDRRGERGARGLC